MEKYGKLIEDHTLQFERILPGPIERVWEYLTDGDKRALWFAGGPMDTVPGGKVEYQFDHNRLSPEKEVIPEKYKDLEGGMTSLADVLTYNEPHLLVIGWEGGEVTFKLEEQGDDVKLTLTHSNLNRDRDARIGTFAGWHTHLDILTDRLNAIDPKAFWKAHNRMEEEYEKRVG
ncbi:SRPBCC family protein [Ekhidna sp.]|uniref:SRPBCC family protein n=1 Tax=Ekhidna sp. TaxID=2608089 RepID=UPI003B502006